MGQFVFGLLFAGLGLALACHAHKLVRSLGVLIAIAGALFVFGSPADPMTSSVLLALIGGFAMFLFSRPSPRIDESIADIDETELAESYEDEA